MIVYSKRKGGKESRNGIPLGGRNEEWKKDWFTFYSVWYNKNKKQRKENLCKCIILDLKYSSFNEYIRFHQNL